MMTSRKLFSIVLLICAIGSKAFTVPSTNTRTASFVTSLSMANDDTPDVASTSERGVSIDQDGKSNVWAIEPKMEVESKSSEEKTGSAIGAIAGFAAFAVAAGVILTNLPDPDTF
eukprot:161784_1